MIKKIVSYSTLIVLIMLCVLGLYAFVLDIITPKCIASGCSDEPAEGSSYCSWHENYYRNKSKYSSSSSSKKSSSSKNSSSSNKSSNSSSSNKNKYPSYSNDSYDEGYDDVYENDDFDWDRYFSDDDYADGVDDAMDELGW